MMSTAKTKPVSARRAKTRERLIEAAAAAVLDKGFRDTTLDEIAARAGMTKGAIYDNFASKDALFVAVMSSKPAHLPIPADRSGTAAERLVAMARAVTADTDANRLQIPLRAEFLLYSLSHPEMRETMAAWLRSGFEAEEAALARAFAPGELPMSPAAFTVMLEAMIPGLMYLRSQSPDLVNEAIVSEIFAALGRGGAAK